MSFIVGCDSQGEFLGRPTPAQAPVLTANITDWNVLYGRNCAGCHGADGQWGAAPPLRDPLLLAILPRETMHELILNGRDGSMMPGFGYHHNGEVSTQQATLIVEGIYDTWGKPPPSGTLPAYSIDAEPGNPQAGREPFATHCAGCHGENGTGGSAGPLNDPALLALISDQFIRRMIITGRTDLKMPDFRGHQAGPNDTKAVELTEGQIADLTALIASWRQSAGTGSNP